MAIESPIIRLLTSQENEKIQLWKYELLEDKIFIFNFHDFTFNVILELSQWTFCVLTMEPLEQVVKSGQS